MLIILGKSSKTVSAESAAAADVLFSSIRNVFEIGLQNNELALLHNSFDQLYM